MPLLLALALNAWALTCGQTISAGSTETLTADLDCSAYIGSPIVQMQSDTTLDGNGFRIIAPQATTVVRVNSSRDNVTILDLDVSATTGLGIGIQLQNNVSDVTISNVVASGRATGVNKGNTGGSVTGVSLTDVDVSDSATMGIQLGQIGLPFTLSGITFDGSASGLAMASCSGAHTLDLSTSTFEGVGAAGGTLVQVSSCNNVTITGLDAPEMEPLATGIRITNSTPSTVSNTLACQGATGISLVNADTAALGTTSLSAFTTGVAVDAATNAAAGTIGVVGNITNVADLSNTANITTTPLADADADRIADICDTCPADPLNDLDGDGLCAGIDPDDDGDGVDDGIDTNPNDPSVCSDLDTDGCDDCAVALMQDTSNDGTDTDGDVLCDAGDPDDDNDGVLDGDDSDPLDELVCRDDDFDSCDDCSTGTYDVADDGADADIDGVCDLEDLFLVPGVNFDRDDLNWPSSAGTPLGVGSPTVVFDPESNRFVMVYESQFGTHGDCPVGTWGLGLATSFDGLTWTDSGPILVPVPQSDTYYECVAAHPTLVDRVPGTLTLFFKTEQGLTPNATSIANWGGDQYTGLGRMLLIWSAGPGTYTVTPPDLTPVLAIGQNFGYPKAVFDNGAGVYRVALTRRPDMMVANGAASALTLGPVVWSPGDAPWTPDEVYNPAVVCEANGDIGAFVGGRGLGTGYTLLEGNVGKLNTADFATWSLDAGPLFSTAIGDTEMRHWDTLRVGTLNYLMYFSDQTGPSGSNRVSLAQTTSSWSPSSVQSKVCP